MLIQTVRTHACQAYLFLGCITWASLSIAGSFGLPIAQPWTNKYKLSAHHVPGEQSSAALVEDLFPLVGSNTHILYLEGGFKGESTTTYLSGVGTGARWMGSLINGHEMILGGFAFTEYQNLPTSQAWYVTPGLELFTPYQNLTFQYYYPLSNAAQSYANTAASNVLPSSVDNQNQLASYTSRSRHTVSDTQGALVNEYGQGFEIDLAQYLPYYYNDWIDVGYYSFTYPSATPIHGVEAGISLDMLANDDSRLSLAVQDTYDNQSNNQITLTITYKFGGYSTNKDLDLANRMEAMIDHSIARPGYALLTPTYNIFVPSASDGSSTTTSHSNWFFSSSGTNPTGTVTLSDCTSENPCQTLTQTLTDGIQTVTPNAALYFETGSYSLPSNPSVSNANAVIMNGGQQIYGRTLNWASPATGSDRPLINGALFWGNNSGSAAEKIARAHIENMQIVTNNVFIPSTISGFTSGTDMSAIALGSTGAMVLRNVSVTDSVSTSNAQAIGAFTLNGGLSAFNSNFNMTTTGTGAVGTDHYFAYGLHTQSGGLLVDNTTIHVTTLGDYAKGFGVYSASLTTAVQSSTITTQTSGLHADAFGIFSASSGIEMSNVTINATATGNNAVVTGGFTEIAGNTITSYGSNVTATASGIGDIAYGLQSSSISFTGTQSIISATALTGNAINATTVNNNSSPISTCITNGVSGACS